MSDIFLSFFPVTIRFEQILYNFYICCPVAGSLNNPIIYDRIIFITKCILVASNCTTCIVLGIKMSRNIERKQYFLSLTVNMIFSKMDGKKSIKTANHQPCPKRCLLYHETALTALAFSNVSSI